VPNSADVRAELTDILVQVVGCPPDDVVDQALLKDLGVDSLAMVEMADELGRRFDRYLSDDTVNGLRTVADAVAAVVRHDGSSSVRTTTYHPAPSTPPPSGQTPPDGHLDPDERREALQRLGWRFAVIGVVVGVVLGLFGTVIVAATGLRESTLPPLSVPTTPAPTTPTPTATATPTPSEEEETVDPDPTLTIADTEVGPGERFTLEGAFPSLGQGATLQVEVKDPGEEWDEFPVTTRTKAEGRYRTQIYTSRTGEREFRMAHTDSDLTTPSVSVRIG
jgi:acyl carrier protein